MINYLGKLNYFLVIIFPISLVAGPAISDSVIVLTSLIFLYISYTNNLWNKYFLNYLAIFFWAWCLLLICRSIFSFNPYLSLESSLFYFRFGLFTLAVCYLIDNYQNFKKHFFWVLLIVIIFVILDSYLQYFTSYDIFGYHFDKTAGLIRMAGPFGDEWILGVFLSKTIATLIALSSLIILKNKNYLIIFILISTFAGGVIFLSGERSAFAIFILFLFLSLIFANRTRLAVIAIILTSIITISIIASNDREIKYRMTQQVIEQVYSEEGKINFYSQTHEKFFISSYRMFNDNKILGIGTKLYREACALDSYAYNNSCSTHPHNYYLQLLAETGVVGTAPVITVFLLSIYYLMKSLAKNKFSRSNYFLINNDYRLFLILAIVINLWPFFPTLNFFNNWSSALMFLPAGFIMHELYFKDKKIKD
jgi:O-antigen ligase